MLPIMAGPERAVAATKSFVGSMVALSGLVAGMSGDMELVDDLRNLPDILEESLNCDWRRASETIADFRSLFVVSRGPGLAVALEAALKLKEVCRIHAEAFSSAEIRHGPVSLAGERFAALVFLPSDISRRSVLETAQSLSNFGTSVLLAGTMRDVGDNLPAMDSRSGVLTPICQIASFYKFVEEFARIMGECPNSPKHISKITMTM